MRGLAQTEMDYRIPAHAVIGTPGNYDDAVVGTVKRSHRAPDQNRSAPPAESSRAYPQYRLQLRSLLDRDTWNRSEFSTHYPFYTNVRNRMVCRKFRRLSVCRTRACS